MREIPSRALLVGLAGIGVLVALHLTQSHRGSTSQHLALSPSQAPAALRRAFPVLGGRPERMPLALVRQITAGPAALAAGNRRFHGAQRLSTADGSAWLITGSGSLCLVKQDPGGIACARIGVSIRRGLALGLVIHPELASKDLARFQLIGVAPIGTRQVRVSVAGQSHILPVSNGLYELSAKAPITVQKLIGSGEASAACAGAARVERYVCLAQKEASSK